MTGYQTDKDGNIRPSASNDSLCQMEDLCASHLGCSLSTNWQQYSVTYTPPANAAFVRVLLYNQRASGWAAFDDLR